MDPGTDVINKALRRVGKGESNFKDEEMLRRVFRWAGVPVPPFEPPPVRDDQAKIDWAARLVEIDAVIDEVDAMIEAQK